MPGKKTSNRSERTSNHIRAKRKFNCGGFGEHRLGLKPVLNWVYVPEGVVPIANVNWRYQWLWLYAFVHPKTGETYWLILPYVNTELFNKVLADFAHEFSLGAKKHILLAVDGAGWHKSIDIKLPPGLHLTFLPPYSRQV